MQSQFYNIARKVDRLVRKYNPKNLETIQGLFRHKGVELYFFTQKLIELEDPRAWLIPLKDKGYFGGEKNPPPEEVKEKPGFYAMPLWDVMPYLENVAKKNKEESSEEITNALIEIIDSIINYKDEKGERVDNYRTDWFLTKIIFMLPYEKWNDEHIQFIGTSLQTQFGGMLIQSEIGRSVLPALIENKKANLILKLLEVIMGFTKDTEDKLDRIKPIMEEYWLSEVLEKFKKNIAKLCGLEAAKIGINKIKDILKEDKGSFSNSWISTIEDSSQIQFPDRYQCQLVFFIRDILENSKTEDIQRIVESLLSEEDNIFKRIGIHTINHHYKEFQDLFWEWKDNPLDEDFCKHEIYMLLKSNCSSFSKEQIQKILEWIESKDYGEYEEERKETVLAYKKKEWLSTLLETENTDVISKYKKYEEKNPEKLDHPGFRIWFDSSAGYGQDISPIEPSKLLSKSNEEIAKYLNEFKEKEEGWKPERISLDGLLDCLRNCIIERPEKFANDMAPFLKIKRVYQEKILQGLKEAWNDKKEFELEGVFCFISQVIEDDELWDEKYDKDKGEFNYRNWLVCEVGEFIENGTQNDEHAFDEKYLPSIEKILLYLAEKAESEDSGTERIYDSVLNSPKGKVFSAMINYALRYARLYGKGKRVRWPKAIKEDFNKRLDREIEKSPDFSVTLGRYLGNILYLDNKWVFENIEKIFPKENSEHWVAGFGGYLSYSQHVYNKTYKLLRENGHYTKALQTKFSEEHITEKLVQHICIGFLEDWEKLEEPENLISLLLNKSDTSYLSDVINFLSTIKEGEPFGKLKERIKPLWKTMFELLQERQEDRDFQVVISRLYRWLNFVDEIDDEIKEWMKLTARYANVGYHASDLLKYLAKHVDKTPKNVAEIYIEMLNAGAYADYDKNDITKIVECLYEKEYKKAADSICNKYGEVGFYFLRKLYDKHNK